MTSEARISSRNRSINEHTVCHASYSTLLEFFRHFENTRRRNGVEEIRRICHRFGSDFIPGNISKSMLCGNLHVITTYPKEFLNGPSTFTLLAVRCFFKDSTKPKASEISPAWVRSQGFSASRKLTHGLETRPC